jgi:hypothetical protein
MMLSTLALARRSTAFATGRSLSTYNPLMVEKREGEMGTGGRSSEAGLKVAVFGGSGFLGHYVCGELGMYYIELTFIRAFACRRLLFNYVVHSLTLRCIIFVVVVVDDIKRYQWLHGVPSKPWR